MVGGREHECRVDGERVLIDVSGRGGAHTLPRQCGVHGREGALACCSLRRLVTLTHRLPVLDHTALIVACVVCMTLRCRRCAGWDTSAIIQLCVLSRQRAVRPTVCMRMRECGCLRLRYVL